jgi:hypothetical protein
MDAAVTVFLIQMNDNFRIGAGVEMVTAPGEVRTQVVIVIDFTVKYDRDRPIFVVYRLITSGDVDNAKPSHPHSDGPANVKSVTVRTSMCDRTRHRLDDVTIILDTETPDDSAHHPVPTL